MKYILMSIFIFLLASCAGTQSKNDKDWFSNLGNITAQDRYFAFAYKSTDKLCTAFNDTNTSQESKELIGDFLRERRGANECNVQGVTVKIPPTRAERSMNNAQSASEAIEVSRDDFKKTTTYIGPILPRSFVRFPEGSRSSVPECKLFAIKADAGQVYYTAIVRDPKQYNKTAFDSDGKNLKVNFIDRDTVAIDFPSEYFKAHSEKSIRIKLYGDSSTAEFEIQQGYINAMLSITK